MTTEINNLNTQGLTNKPGVRRSPVPTERPAIPGSQNNQVTADNVVRADFGTRQTVATETVQPTLADTGQRAQSEESIAQALNEVNTSVQAVSRKLEFRVDDNSGRTVITVRDSDTQEVIRQIPSEQLLDIAARIEEIKLDRSSGSPIEAQGILFTSTT